MSKAEIKRVSSQFATDFPNAEKGKTYPYENRHHFYMIEVSDFGNYRFKCKIPIEGNEEKIKAVREVYKDES